MKKTYYILWLVALLSLTLPGCGKKSTFELPPPNYTPPSNTENPGDDPGEGGEGEDPGSTTPPGAWEANRGKVVTPSGEGWTSKTVAEGITYYAFAGKDPCSNAQQRVYAVDVDLSNTRYKVKMTYESKGIAPSDVHKNNNAIATINAGYEAGSIYIKVDGSAKSMLPNSYIGTTGVRNWKSEAGWFCDGERTMSIARAEELIRPYQSPADGEMSAYITKQRNFYFNHSEKYILSSSPMLLDDFKPVGETFIDPSYPNWNKLNSEEPQYHQRQRHPRTAIAITENKHFIMLVVDGRQTNRSGMSARELTQFFVANFNPQYALNLDGGGSTAMCVKGLAASDYTDSARELVDSPIQDNQPGKERPRDTHIVIVAAN